VASALRRNQSDHNVGPMTVVFFRRKDNGGAGLGDLRAWKGANDHIAGLQ
jgi:hypothetical protein